MISRVADHCFWFGRYLERAESTSRVLGVTHNLALDAELTPRECWLPVIIVAGEEKGFASRMGEGAASDGELVQRFMAWDEDNFVSVRRSVAAARDNARSIRETLSIEAWEAINELHIWFGSPAAAAEYADNRYAFYRHVRQSTQLCLGLLRSTMLHDTPLDFIWLGVLLERVSQTARLLDVHHHVITIPPRRHEVVETSLWLSLLRAYSGFEPFMKRRQGRVTGDAVARFLVFEAAFPRSIAYCIHSAHSRYGDIRPPERNDLPGGATGLRLGALVEWLAKRHGDSLDDATLHPLLTHIVDEVHAVCEGIGRELFGYGAPTQSQSQSQ
jgi:uncharacterized alpha-E superfamily protein